MHLCQSSQDHAADYKPFTLAAMVRHCSSCRQDQAAQEGKAQNKLTAFEWASKLLAQPPKMITSPSSLAQAVCHNLETEVSTALKQKSTPPNNACIGFVVKVNTREVALPPMHRRHD